MVLVQFDCGTRILRVIHGRDARATLKVNQYLKTFLLAVSESSHYYRDPITQFRAPGCADPSRSNSQNLSKVYKEESK
jgi:hypothetical protein